MFCRYFHTTPTSGFLLSVLTIDVVHLKWLVCTLKFKIVITFIRIISCLAVVRKFDFNILFSIILITLCLADDQFGALCVKCNLGMSCVSKYSISCYSVFELEKNNPLLTIMFSCFFLPGTLSHGILKLLVNLKQLHLCT